MKCGCVRRLCLSDPKTIQFMPGSYHKSLSYLVLISLLISFLVYEPQDKLTARSLYRL